MPAPHHSIALIHSLLITHLYSIFFYIHFQVSIHFWDKISLSKTRRYLIISHLCFHTGLGCSLLWPVKLRLWLLLVCQPHLTPSILPMLYCSLALWCLFTLDSPFLFPLQHSNSSCYINTWLRYLLIRWWSWWLLVSLSLCLYLLCTLCKLFL